MSLPRWISNLAGNEELYQNRPYKLYRGLNLRHNDPSYSNYYDISKIRKTKIFKDEKGKMFSWSMHKGIATSFAYGNTNWMQNKNCFDDLEIGWGHYGIVLEHTFSPSEIIIDFEFADNNNRYLKNFMDFSEDEVLVKPRRTNYKVIEILENRCKK